MEKNGKLYGFRTLRIFEPDENWAQKVLDEADRIAKLEESEHA